jgi:hypothetical protein
VVLCAAAGTGVVYLLRRAGGLSAGPDVRGALPLQQLAGGEAQPLARLLLAWVPAGGFAALALAWLTRLRPATRAIGVAAGFFVVLGLTGALSDAVAVTDPIGPHLVPQLSRPATWVASGLALTGALLPALWSRLAGAGRAASAA